MEKFESGRNTLFSVILGQTLNVILGFIPRIHTKHSPLLDTRDTPEYDGNKRQCFVSEYDKDLRLSTSILKHTLNVILGFIPRIHAEQNSNRHYQACPDNLGPRVKPEYDGRKRMCFKPEYDREQSLIKGLDVVRQCAALLERRVQSGTRVRKAQAVTRQTNPIGRSMIEMLGVLAIIGVLSVGGIAGYSKAMEKFKINKTIQQITEIATNIQTLYLQQDDFNGLDNATAVQMGVVPDDLKTSAGIGMYFGGTEISHAFNGKVYIRYDDDNPKSFFITLNGLPKEACMTLATINWGSSSTGLVGILVGETSLFMSDSYNLLVKNGTEGIHNGGSHKGYYANAPYLPLSPAKVLDACGEPYSSYAPGFSIKFTK